MRLARVIAGVTVAAAVLAPAVAHAADAPTRPTTSGPTTAPTTGPTLDAPDPLAIAPSAIANLTSLALRYQSNLSVAEDRRRVAAERQRDADHQQGLARAYVAQVVDYAMSPSGDPFAQKLTALAAAENPQDLVTGVYSTEQVTEAQEGHLADAKQAYDAAQALQARADALTRQARRAEADAQRQLAQLGDLAEQLGLGASSTPAGLPGTHTEQETWNAEAAASWRAYTDQLSRLGVAIPTAAQVRSSGGFTTATVGSTTVEVLPLQTIRMVDAVLARVGDDYAAENGSTGGVAAWSCGGLVDVAGGYGLTGTPAELYARTVAVDAKDVRPGDLVFSATEASGIHHVAVYVGDGKVVDAAATRGQVGISAMPEKPFAVTRPALGRGTNVAPVATEKAPPTVCNATRPAAPTRQAWTFPLAAGTYRISAGFGQAGGMWKTVHTGQDLSAPMGTPIYASRGGTVSLEEVGWAGTLITISHPDGTAERYAHSSRQLVQDGQTVAAGDEIALVGARGNTTGPHLHFEITVNGEFIDPMPVLVQTLTNAGAGSGWGGYGNGQIPRGVLCPVDDVLLRCDLARRTTALAADFRAKFDRDLDLTAGYRDLVGQIERGPDGDLVDIPGTSPFGWGTRFTIGETTSAEATWLGKRAPKLGLTAQGDATWSIG